MSGSRQDVKTDGRINVNEHPDWLERACRSLGTMGFVVLDNVFDEKFVESARKEAYDCLESERRYLVDSDREPAFAHFLMLHDPQFLELLKVDSIINLARIYLAPDAILRNMFGQIVKPETLSRSDNQIFTSFHRNFRHLENSPGVSFEFTILLDDLIVGNGSADVVPGSHKWREFPSKEELVCKAESLSAKAGSVLAMDGMCWHRANQDKLSRELATINLEFSLPIIKPYIDFCRLFGEPAIAGLPEQVRRLLGWYARVPSSQEEFFQPGERRFFQVTGSESYRPWRIP